MKSKLLRIYGQVQGVFFRDSFCKEAEKLSVTGWVRNRKDKTVEALVQGDNHSIEKILSWVHQGPPAAQVEKVDVLDAPEEGVACSDFTKRPTV